jgi:WD40 repeat protein
VVECVHATGADTFVSGGSDGRVKIWRYEAPERPSVNANGGSADLAGRLMCIFTSTPSETTFADRPEESKYRVAMRPDGIVCARYDEERDVLCSVSSDGELRVWFDLTTKPCEVRVDVGARHEYGGVTRIELDVRDGIASVLVLHDGHSDLVGNGDLLYRFDIEPDGSSLRTAFVGAGNITALHVDVAPTLPITKAVTTKADTPSLPSTPDTEPTTPLPDLTTPITQADERGKYGRYVVVGNSSGECAWYAWDDLKGASSDLREPLRKWTAGRGAVSSIDAAASLVAVGTYVYSLYPRPSIV